MSPGVHLLQPVLALLKAEGLLPACHISIQYSAAGNVQSISVTMPDAAEFKSDVERATHPAVRVVNLGNSCVSCLHLVRAEPARCAHPNATSIGGESRCPLDALDNDPGE